MKKSKLFTLICLGVFIVSFITFMLMPPFKDSITKCGTVVRQYEDGVLTGKHKTNYEHEFYLDVKFDDGTFETMNVTTNTWYKNPQNSRPCFSFDDLKQRDKQVPVGVVIMVSFCGFASFFFTRLIVGSWW